MPQESLAKGSNRSAGGAAIDRMAALQRWCSQESLTSILITDAIDVAYISGFSSSYAALLIHPKKNRLFTDFRYQTEAANFCRRHPKWHHERVSSSIIESVGSFMAPGDIVGYQSDRMTVDDLNKLKKSAHGARFVSCSKAVNDLLLTRLPGEIAAMERAAKAGDAAFKSILNDIHPGVTERELARLLDEYCSDSGSEKPAFDTIVLFGDRTALPHGKPGERKLKRGDPVLLDFGCTVGGFASDMTRTVFVGRATRRQREIYRVVRDAQRQVFEHARAGMTTCAIDSLARALITEAGYAEYFGHALGHGIGRRIHEAPRISAQVSLEVPPGAVVTIEPGIYIPGFGGIRIEDMAVVRPDGVRLLTSSPRELVEV